MHSAPSQLRGVPLAVAARHDERMTELLRLADLIRPGQKTRTARFDGADHGAQASFFFVDNDPGQGPGLHWHPYSETWIVLDGVVRFRLGDALGEDEDTAIEEMDAGAGTVFTVPPERHHGFVNPGPEVLRMVCIHAGERIVQYDLEE